ncbi:GAF domain-containing protein [Idiomarina xiamenensis]|uniref:Signal protein n=1 Tax=Idiomarina xiamenensis 10-D-4 TaxID=740709 RepID=K2JUC3_9GAMM|nr:GAF domain-containing protein [Idiomarina xiamenensis]EKE87036.1 signal protein [Idiomarina xiamenensis 10-D-4]
MSTDTLYRDMLNQIKALCADEPDLIANLANISALIYDQLDDINWAGFYLTRAPQMLVLGPFQGKVACVRIPFSQGVCGAAARTQEAQLVADVHQFSGHIACDSASNSEVVIPIVVDGNTVAVLDIDSPSVNRFDKADQQGLQAIGDYLQSLDWS